MHSADKEALLINEEDVERGGESIVNDFAYKNNVANASIQIRLGFLRKVYSLLALQLGFSVLFGAVCMFSSIVQFFVRNNPWLLTLAFFASLGIILALFVKRRHHPTNLILLAAFTVVQSYTVGVVITYYDQLVVLEAFFLTLSVVAGLTLFTMQTKKDFSSMGAGLYAGLCVLIVGGFLQLFIGGSGMDFLISIGGALLFSLFIIYDTQLIMTSLSPEEYILATINLYMDIINLFIYILRILGSRRN